MRLPDAVDRLRHAVDPLNDAVDTLRYAVDLRPDAVDAPVTRGLAER